MLIPILVFVSLVSIAGYNVATALPDHPQPDPPAAPKLEAMPGNQQVTLTWDVPYNGGQTIRTYGILGYVNDKFTLIQFFSGSVRTATIACSADLTCQSPVTTSGSGNTIRVTLSNLEQNQEYRFKVYAESTVQGNDSNEVSVTTFDTPGAPKNLLVYHGNTTAMLEWEAPNDNGGTPITAYMIFARIGTVNPLTPFAAVSAAATSYNATGLTNGIPYQFIIHAVNEVGSGDMSNSVTITPAGLPGPPKNFAATPGNNAITLTWEEPDDTGGPSIKRYAIDGRVGDTGFRSFNTVPDIVSGTSNSQTITGLTGGIAYDFRIIANNGYGWGPYAVINDIVPRGVPFVHELTGTAGVESAKLEWRLDTSTTCIIAQGLNSYFNFQHEVCFDAGEQPWLDTPITEYVISTNTGNSNIQINDVILPATASSHEFKNLTNGVSYEFTVRANNNAGDGDSSNTVTLTPAHLPGAVDDLKVKVTSSKFQISWDAPTHFEYAPITEYVVTASARQATSSADLVREYRVPGDTISTEIDRLTNADYTITVYAVNRIGNGPPSDEYSYIRVSGPE